MKTANTTERVTVDLLVRSQAGIGARDKQQAVVETLADLKRRAAIDDFAVRVCGSEVCMEMPSDDLPGGKSIVSLVTQVRAWGREREVAIDDVFRERTIASSFVDEEYTVVKLPYLSLLVFEGETLTDVYPCHEEGSFCPVETALEALGRRTEPLTRNELSVEV